MIGKYLDLASPVNTEYQPFKSGLLGLWLFDWYTRSSKLVNLASPGDGGLTVTGAYTADGLDCNNTNGAYYPTQPAALKPTAAVTFVWFGTLRASYDGPSNPIVGGSSYSASNTSPYSNWDIARRDGTSCYFAINTGGTQAYFTPTVPIGRPTALGITYKSGEFRPWVDGQPVDSAGTTGTISYSADPQLNFGTNFTRDPDCVVRASFVWDRALSAGEMGSVYEQCLRGYPDMLRRYSRRAWLFGTAGGGGGGGFQAAWARGSNVIIGAGGAA